MTLIKKIWSLLISMKLMVVLILIFAVASGVATFIENDHGINTSWALVYSTRWFEAVQVLLGISIIGNIFKYKMYTKKKLPTFIFHIAFLFVLLGSGITRYYGYEGVMNIREGSTEHRMLSSDAFLQVSANKNNTKYYEEDIVYISALGGREFKTTLDVDGKDITVKYKKFIDKAVKTAVEDPSGVPIVSFVITTPQGPEKFFLKSGDFIDLGPLAVYFDKEPEGVPKPIVRLISNGDKISFVSNVQINWMKMADRSEGLYDVGREYPFEAKKLYNINGIQLVSKAVLAKGKVTVVDEATYKSTAKMNMKFASLSALVVDVEYDGTHKEVALMGSGKRYKGYTENIKIADTEIALEWGSKIIELPFSLRLRDFKLIKYPGSMSPSSYESHVTLIDKKNLVKQEHRIYMNNVLDYGGYLFFQSSYDKDEKGTILSVNHDPGKWPTYLGYTLLAIGLFLNFFNPNGRFGKLARSKYEYKAGVTASLLMLFALFSTQPLVASSELIEKVKNIDAGHADHYGTLLVQSRDGRIKPLDSFATELLNKISAKDSMFGLSHNQILLGMASNPDVWKQIDMIKVAHPKVQKLLGIDESKKRFAYRDAFDRNGQYKLGELAEQALRKRSATRDMFDKELIKVDERVNVAYMIYSGRFMTVFPLEGDVNNKWYYPEEALQSFPPEASKEVLSLLRNNSMGLVNGINRGTWEEANKAIDDIKEYQKKYSPSIIPDPMLIEAELLYNKMNVFDKLYPIYLIAGLVLLVLIFVRLAKPNINIEVVTRIVLAVFVVAFVVHTMNLGLRWYIAGHAPWSNGYEAMLYISWTIILAGILFARSSELAVATTGIFSGITLFVAHLSWLNPQITTMVPVLKSYWLTIHVSIITASYGFLGLSTLLGFVTLIFYIMLSNKDKREQISVNILEATRISEMSMIVGLSLLTVGNFLGGVWANESWGRYWGWDPKETWALVTILVYVFVIHMRFVPALKSNFTFNAVSVVAYSSVIMTYFGVNYYLSGLHSYAAGDPVPVPEWIYYVISVIIILIVSAWFNRNKLVNIKPIKQ
ncbi:cytochrome c biogenesis protein CcsA [Candidatus Sulfurimonas marisnigri]|uniref:Cytochrome c biogenesis protein CcsA n=1 Tax=Candidatus Sulfurimonas marisnigri TaxID=2740405 RepID=A0A7S7RQG2_9BACT|nr:cytochrome c biogenesis protein CcsA [Candidatus Sulfurimonas marisnigri]QOY54435.1 cytochrome c biogenesis protein CcsA [Candidatus Sulfurimonas marisnigri]